MRKSQIQLKAAMLVDKANQIFYELILQIGHNKNYACQIGNKFNVKY